MKSIHEPLSIKELAAAIPPGRSRGYVQAMKRSGFKMPGGKASFAAALSWLYYHPDFTWRGVYVGRKLHLSRRSSGGKLSRKRQIDLPRVATTPP
jgi:hypothetical protein